MTNLIYIAGSGRSGSTLLERIIHSMPNTFALGEFHCLWRLPADEISCSCGQAFSDDPFWKEVMDVADITSREIEELRVLEERICRTGFIMKHRYNLTSIRNDADVKRFNILNEQIFSAIRQVTGAQVLIDSSKAAPRAWILATAPDVKIWHLWRDPIEVISSWRSKKFDKGLGSEMQRLSYKQAAEDWIKVEMLIGKLAKKCDVAKIDYQTLCRDPVATCDYLLKSTFDAPEHKPNWVNDNTFSQADMYHSVNGNPDRFMKGDITVSYRAVQREKLSTIDWRAARSIGGALKAVYPAPRLKV